MMSAGEARERERERETGGRERVLFKTKIDKKMKYINNTLHVF